jgi:hypothetical protein
MTTKTAKQVLDNLKAHLELCNLGLKDLLSDNQNYTNLGLRNLTMHGVTFAFELQYLKNTEPALYEEIEAEMDTSELCGYFSDLSIELEKQQAVRPKGNTNDSFTVEMFNRLSQPEVAQVIGFFIGDILGGYGWDIALPDGQKDKFYLELPMKHINMEALTTIPAGSSLEGKTIQELGKMYFNYLTDIFNRISTKIS